MSTHALSRAELTTLVLDLKARVEELEKGREWKFPSSEEIGQMLLRSVPPEDLKDVADDTPVSVDELGSVLPFQRRE